MTHTLSRRELLRASAATLFGVSLMRSAGGAGATRVKIANAAGSLNMTMSALLRQQKFLEQYEIAPEFLDVADGTRILGGLVGKSIDVSMMSGFGQVFPAIERGAPIRIIAGAVLLPALALYSGKPDVTTLRQLEGRTIATGSIGALIHQLTLALLLKHDVNVSGIRFVNVGSSADILRAVQAGTVDAGAADVALLEHAPERRVHALERGNMSLELPEYTYSGSWTLARNIETQREQLVRTLAAYAKLYRFAQSPDAEDAFLRASRTALPKSAAKDAQALWKYIQTYKPFAVNLALSPERLRYLQALNVRLKTQKQALPFERVADMSLAADALALLEKNRG